MRLSHGPDNGQSISLGVTVPERMAARIRAEAVRRDISVKQMIIEMLEAWFASQREAQRLREEIATAQYRSDYDREGMDADA
jgi:hypothetical protein